MYETCHEPQSLLRRPLSRECAPCLLDTHQHTHRFATGRVWFLCCQQQITSSWCPRPPCNRESERKKKGVDNITKSRTRSGEGRTSKNVFFYAPCSQSVRPALQSARESRTEVNVHNERITPWILIHLLNSCYIFGKRMSLVREGRNVPSAHCVQWTVQVKQESAT